MAVERERKFLIINELLPEFSESHHINHVYLPAGNALSLRIRIMDNTAYLNIKGPDDQGVRPEFEFRISLEEAEEMIASFKTSVLRKIRHIIYFEGYKWEVDEFLEENKGLWLAEVEYKSADEIIPLPTWIAKEVTGNPRYLNSNLAKAKN